MPAQTVEEGDWNMMKKALSLLLLLPVMALLTACAGSKAGTGAAPAETTAAETAEEVELGAGIGALAGAAAVAEAGTEAAVPETAEAAGTETAAEMQVESGAEEIAEREDPDRDNLTLTLAAASNLKFLLEEQILPQFEEQHPDLKVEGIYDNSEKLKERIEKGTNYDLFFCASKKPMSSLVEQGLIMEDSVRFLMSNELVLFVPRTSRLGITGVSDITKVSTVGIGDPADVPVGEFTVETLKDQDLWDVVREKEVYLGSSVDELIRWVVDGTVDCAFAYRNDVIEHLDQVYAVEGLAPTTYRIGILSSTGRLEAATAFADFLATDEVLAQFVANGFTLPQ